MTAVDYVKHLVECNCVLPQYKHYDPPVWHQFVVFSELDEQGNVIPSFAKCNNCGVVHKVKEVGLSSILKREDFPGIPSIEEVKQDIPEKMVALLEKYQCELPTYQEVSFIFRNQKWGKGVILTKDKLDGTLIGKYAQILGETLWRIETFQEEYDEQ